jgi:hypothetical protein
MTWFKVDDSFYDHPKIMGVSLAARGLWTACGSYAARHLTNGRVADLVIVMIGGDEADTCRRELIDAGLWKPATGGIQFHDWAEYQPSRESVLAERAAARERQRRAREAARQKRDGDVCHGDSHAVTSPELTDEVTDESQRESRSPRPDPTRPVVPTELPLGAAPARPPRATRIPGDFDVTDLMRAWAAKNVPGIDVDAQTEKFRDHHTAKGSAMKDWTAAWRNWMRNAPQFSRPPGKAQSPRAHRTDLPEAWQ